MIEQPNLARRGFLRGMAGILAAGVAPAYIGSKILMPVRELALPTTQLAGSIESGVMTYKVIIKWNAEDANGNPIDLEKLPGKGRWYKQDGSEILVSQT